MRSISTAFYGDDSRWFVGVVRALQPATGRVRVRVYGVHNDSEKSIADDKLPWAQVIMPNNTSGISGLTPATGLRIGATVFGFFMDGKSSQLPLVLGAIVGLAIAPHLINADGTISAYAPLSGDIPQPYEYNNIPMSEGSNTEVIFDYIHAYMSQNGMANPVAVASGFIGNFINESGVNLTPNRQETAPIAGRGGFGIAQWTGQRRRSLETFANNVGVQLPGSGQLTPAENLAVLQLQLQFWAVEMEGSHRYVFRSLKNATSVEEATKIVFDKYETPAIVVDYLLVVENRPPRYHPTTTDIAARYNAELNNRISAAIAVEENFGQ